MYDLPDGDVWLLLDLPAPYDPQGPSSRWVHAYGLILNNLSALPRGNGSAIGGFARRSTPALSSWVVGCPGWTTGVQGRICAQRTQRPANWPVRPCGI